MRKWVYLLFSKGDESGKEVRELLNILKKKNPGIILPIFKMIEVSDR